MIFDSFNSTGGKMYIVELSSPYERLMIQFVPDEIRFPRTADIGMVAVVGRNHKKPHYYGGEEELSFSFDMLADDDKREDVDRAVNWLKSLSMNDGGANKFRNVKIVAGRFLANEVFVVKSVNPVFTYLDLDKDCMPLRATVDITLILDPKKNMTIKDRRDSL